MAFVAEHLGTDDPVWKHTAHVLCYERYTTRFTKPVSEKKAFEKKIGKAPDMQKFMVQINKSQKAERQARKKWTKPRSGSDQEKVADNVEAMLGQIVQEKQPDDKQKETLIGLFKASTTARFDTDEHKQVEQWNKVEEFM